MRQLNRIRALAWPAIACSVPLVSANAAPVLPTSSTVSDILQFTTVSDGGHAYQCNEGSCDTILTGSLGTGLEIATSSLNGTGVYFTEPGSGAVSDYVFACNGFIAFASDDESGNFSLPACAKNVDGRVDTTFANGGAETGNYVDIFGRFAGLCLGPTSCPGSGAEGTALTFASDVSDPQGVPEPATWAVMLTGLLSLFGFGMMRRRTNA